MALVEALGDAEGGFGAEAELAIGLALQGGQIEQQRAGLRGRLAFFGNCGFFATHSVGNGLGFTFRPHAVGLDFSVVGVFFVGWVEPFTRILTRLCGKRAVDFPIISADELADFLFALDDDRQSRRLHTAHRCQKEATVARIKSGHGTGAVDADQPIGLRTAAGGVGQRQHLLVGTQAGEAVTNRLWRHGLQPQARDRVFGLAVLLDQAEDQFTLTSRVTGVDECVHVFAFGELDNGIQPRLGLVHGLEVKMRRNDRQVGKAPFAAFDVKFFGRLDLQQVAYGAGDDVGVVLKMLVQLLEFTGNRRERFDDVIRHGWFFRNNQCFHTFSIPIYSRYNSCISRAHARTRTY